MMARFREKAALAMICGASIGVVLLIGLRILPSTPAYAQGGAVVPTQYLIQTRRLEVVDAAGKARVVMMTDDQGVAGVAVLGGDGVNRASLTVAKDGTPTFYQYAKATQTAPPPPAPAGAIDPNLQLLDSQVVHEQFGDYLVCTVKNATAGQYAFVEIDFNLYDKDGAQIGHAGTSTVNLEPGGLWKIKIPFVSKQAATFKLKVLKGH